VTIGKHKSMTAVTTAEPEDLDRLSGERFRLPVRRWIEESYPPELRNPPRRLHFSENKPWYMTRAEQGWPLHRPTRRRIKSSRPDARGGAN
jgi:hypothetical protein